MSTPKVYQRHGARQHGQITVRLSSASTSIARPRAPKLQAHRRWRAPGSPIAIGSLLARFERLHPHDSRRMYSDIPWPASWARPKHLPLRLRTKAICVARFGAAPESAWWEAKVGERFAITWVRSLESIDGERVRRLAAPTVGLD